MVTVSADPTGTSFSNLANSANLEAPVTVNAAPIVARCDLMSPLIVTPAPTVMSVALND